jgi:hypothetical protein
MEWCTRWAIPLRDAIAEAGGLTVSDAWVQPPDLRWLDFVYQLGEIAARGGDIREHLFGAGSAASEPT